MDNNQYYSHGGNNAYYQGGQPYTQVDPFENESENSGNFNPIEWFFTFLHYWYLFVIAIAIALGLAMLKNRKWIPTFYTQGTIVIKEGSAYGAYGGASSLMQGFGVDAGYKNVNNQLIMLGSYDLMSRVVDSLPFMRVDYITQGRFKTRNIYKNTPVLIEPLRVATEAYQNNILYQIEFDKDGNTMHISSTDDKYPMHVDAHYSELVSCPHFDLVITPTDIISNSGKMYFRLRSKSSLIDEFMARLKLSFVSEGATVVALSLESETPQRDCDFIDKLVEIYLLQNLEKKNEVAENTIRFINDQLGTLQLSLQVSEAAMTDFRQENKFIDVNSYANELMRRVEEYKQQRLSLRLRERYFDYLINYIHKNIEEDAVIAPSSMGVKEPMLVSLVQQLNDLRVARGELTEKNVYYAKYTNDIANVKEAIEEVVGSMRASLEIEKADLETRYAELEDQIKTLPEKELQMVAIDRSYRIDDNYYTYFLQKSAEAEIQKASNTPDNSVLDRARVISVTNAKAKSKTTMMYLVLGLLIPMVLIVLSELLNNKIRTPKDVIKMHTFNLIGTLRHARSQNPTLVKSSPRSSYAEMLRAIRARMEFILRRKSQMIVSVTSTESGDGKTFLATNLASLYAMAGKKTILIDLDLRKPNIHTKLGLKSGNGISNYLIGDCKFEDILETNTPFGFDFVRAGTIPPNPGELIHSDELINLLADLRNKYEYIIIDTSPIGLVPDAYTIVEQSDLCLFVIRCMQTNKSFCKQTLEQMKEVAENQDKIQLVLSDIPTEGRHAYGTGYGYGYGGYGGYGYGYGGYGYGYGRYGNTKRGGLYGKLFEKISKQDKAYQAYNYYHHDEDDEESKGKGTGNV